MTETVATYQDQAAVIEQVVIEGNLAKLEPNQRVTYYRKVCDSLGLNYLTKPFAYITLNGKLTLYALRGATDQLRQSRKISVELTSRETIDDVHIVTARATAPDGRVDTSTGAVSIKGLTGENLANAMMKAETKAKRRVTLSLVGLGWMDESEIVTVPNALTVIVDQDTGEIQGEPTTHKKKPTERPFSPDVLKGMFDRKLADVPIEPASSGMRGATVGALNNLFTFGGASKESATDMRHKLTGYLVGQTDSAGLMHAECAVFLSWSQDEDATGAKVPHAMAIQEAAQIVAFVEAQQGQQQLMGDE